MWKVGLPGWNFWCKQRCCFVKIGWILTVTSKVPQTIILAALPSTFIQTPIRLLNTLYLTILLYFTVSDFFFIPLIFYRMLISGKEMIKKKISDLCQKYLILKYAFREQIITHDILEISWSKAFILEIDVISLADI